MEKKKKRVIASHNSWSFLAPASRIMRLFRFMARCQEVNIKQQFEYGVRCFDLRVRFDQYGSPYFCHGLMRYHGSPHEHLYLLNHLSHLTSDKVYCRVMLEDHMFTRDRDYQEQCFAAFCCRLQHNIGYKQLQFFGGWTKYGWRDRMLFRFQGDEPTVLELHSSVCGSMFSALWPRRFAKRHNKDFREGSCNAQILMLDFVNL